MPNVIEKAKTRFSPGKGKMHDLLEQQARLHAEIAALVDRREDLRRQEQELLAIANAPVGNDPLARLVARERHEALRPQWDHIERELSQLAQRHQEVTARLQPLLEAVRTHKQNLVTAANPPAFLELSLKQRVTAWAKSAAALHGLVGLDLPRRLPEPSEAERLIQQANDAYGRLFYPGR